VGELIAKYKLFAQRVKTRVECFSLIKHKTCAPIMALSNLFEILENAAIELIAMRHTDRLHKQASFLAANPTGTKANNCFSFERLTVRFDSLGELAKLL
jgi:hypothetical protein